MTTELKRRLRRSLWFAAAFGLAVCPVVLEADPAIGAPVPYDTPAAPYDTQQAPRATEPDVLPGGEVHYYTDTELEDLVSRIALYPDDLIAIVLPAATYPLQVVEAERLLERTESGGNPQANPQWDPSVVALLNYPDVVKLMNDDLEWMSRLGEASVNQRTDVLAAVSHFRDRAYNAGNLRSDDHQTVTRNDEAIEIAPAEPQVIYVPYYEPASVIVYQPYPVFHYYPRPYPVYYYPYPPNYWYGPYRPWWPRHFWGVNIVFNIGWHSNDVFVHDHGHVRPPHWGPCGDPWRRDPWRNDRNHRNGRDDHWNGRDDSLQARATPNTNPTQPDHRQTPRPPARAQANSLVAANDARDTRDTRGDKGKTVAARGSTSPQATSKDADGRGPRRGIEPPDKARQPVRLADNDPRVARPDTSARPAPAPSANTTRSQPAPQPVQPASRSAPPAYTQQHSAPSLYTQGSAASLYNMPQRSAPPAYTQQPQQRSALPAYTQQPQQRSAPPAYTPQPQQRGAPPAYTPQPQQRSAPVAYAPTGDSRGSPSGGARGAEARPAPQSSPQAAPTSSRGSSGGNSSQHSSSSGPSARSGGHDSGNRK